MCAFPSENILKLRELTKKMCEDSNKKDYREIVSHVNDIVINVDSEIKKTNSVKNKVIAYKKMFEKLKNILNINN